MQIEVFISIACLSLSMRSSFIYLFYFDIYYFIWQLALYLFLEQLIVSVATWRNDLLHLLISKGLHSCVRRK